ncbi:MAG: phosphatase PAP2 family protein [Candidatus Rokubacteria bacterium]|nr:phosphatase PAP2 family protein [Candidatus Rokubacteria bacterium]
MGSAGVFLALALFVHLGGWLPGERALEEAVVGRASPAVISIFQAFNYLGDKRILLPATLLLLWSAPADARRRWWLWAGVMVAAPVLEGLGKEVIGRLRPMGNAYGFPSGHATAASAFFFLAAYLIGKRLDRSGSRVTLLWIAAATLIALVAVARIVLQAHWPGDTLGGAALGLACVSLAAWYHERSAEASGAGT